ncbi:methylmalonyl-CoA/ethylmalonyl-CoA epimerase [Alkalihalobacillus xiaoxiensis]|uniref:Methylmalonyl-CoA/ethylmalonyl-CoA epimerase n=1 Tax=Shouchella xiaoxiensis TaxID=766895 RepID=A0ABS2SRP5_9BACI|nr:VOC family protein [Shouchella xiaoxiensis]MBM7838172.1 methylmalonyl-CoA/ethylmalonyl-CoA epimerase [Shouchella xiaoxiensis]
MNSLRFDHIAYAIESREQVKLFTKRFNIIDSEEERIENQGVDVIFLYSNAFTIELIQPLAANQSLIRFIKKHRTPCFHHLAYSVPHLVRARNLFQANGFEFTHTIERGSHNRLISFIKPSYTNGILIELCEANNVNQMKTCDMIEKNLIHNGVNESDESISRGIY